MTDQLGAAIVRDAVDREVIAFGGEAIFLGKIDADYRTAVEQKIDGWPKSDDDWYPTIRNELKRLKAENR